MMKIAASALALVACLAAASPALATGPRTNGKIAFSAVPEQRRYTSEAIFTAWPGGGGLKQLTGRNATRPNAATNPVFSPDGTRIAFFADGFLRIMHADGSRSRKVISLEPRRNLGLAGPAAWSRDGRTLALNGYTSTYDPAEAESYVDEAAIYTVRANGSRLRRLRAGINPTWSPDGRSIAYQRWSNCGGINLMAASGARPRTLVRGRCSAGGATPNDFSPDGRTLIFSRTNSFTNSTAPVSDLFTVNVATRKVRQVTRTPRYAEEDARWSPDGRRLAFARRARTSNRPKVFGTFIATPSGRVLSRFHRYALRVSWQPRN